MKQLLTQYKELYRAVEAFKEANKQVFETYETMLTTIAETETAIKDKAREKKEDISHDGVEVKVTRRWKKWYDYLLLPQKDRAKLDKEGGIKHEVIKEVMEEMVRDGKLSRETQAMSFREEEMSSAISVKIIQ